VKEKFPEGSTKEPKVPRTELKVVDKLPTLGINFISKFETHFFG
jgi:hypothetical protein